MAGNKIVSDEKIVEGMEKAAKENNIKLLTENQTDIMAYYAFVIEQIAGFLKEDS